MRGSNEGFSDEQPSGQRAHRADQDRTLQAMYRLEGALLEAVPGRETSWREQVLDAHSVLDSATAEEMDNADFHTGDSPQR